MPLLDPLIPAIISSGLALLFLLALVHKLRDWGRFREALGGYVLVPRSTLSVAATLVVLAELAVVAGSLAAATRPAALVLAALVLALYATAMATNLARGRVLADCGCGGFGRRQHLAWWMVRRNVALAALALVAAWPTASRDWTLPELFVISCATAAGAGLYLAHATLADNRQYVSR